MMEEARTKDDLSIDPDASGTLSAQLTLQAQNSSKLNSKVSLGSDTESVISINPAGVSRELSHMRGYSAATSEPSAESSVMLQTAMHHHASSTQPSEDVIDAVAAVLKFGMRKWGTDAFMNIQMARFYWVHRANPHKMAMSLQAGFEQKPLIDYGELATTRTQEWLLASTLTSRLIVLCFSCYDCVLPPHVGAQAEGR